MFDHTLKMHASPSFSCYSSGKLAETASRVVEELNAESQSEIDQLFDIKNVEKQSDGAQERRIQEQSEETEINNIEGGEDGKDDDDNDDFEFAFVTKTSLIAADEIFYNGQILPMFPTLNRDLLICDTQIENSEPSKSPPLSSIRLPLKKLSIEARDSPSYSSSEACELDGVPPGNYCVWRPQAVEESPGRCKKSNSTGSSKRWKFRDLLFRSNSDGKDTFVFLTPSNANKKKKREKVEKAPATRTTEALKETEKVMVKGTAGGNGVTVKATYTKNGVAKEFHNRRRSYLPYRQDLVGFFTNANGLTKNLHPF